MKRFIKTNKLMSIDKFNKLQKEFKYNYNTLSRPYFNALDKDMQIVMLQNEFSYDKYLLNTIKLKHGLISKKIINNCISYIYNTSVLSLQENSGDFIHVRHNALRTISAFLLKDCSEEEKIIILASFIKEKAPYEELIHSAQHRLESLNVMLNNIENTL